MLALAVMPILGWRWLLVLSTLPLFVFTLITPVSKNLELVRSSLEILQNDAQLFLKWLPESAMFDASSGRMDKALSTLERVARENGKPMPLGRLVIDRCYPSGRGRLRDLLSPEMRRTSILLWLVWSVPTTRL